MPARDAPGATVVNGAQQGQREAPVSQEEPLEAEPFAVERPAATWRLDISYEGTAYHGWARQPGERTVQGVVEEALETVLRRPVRLSVAGRTDAGVHAWAQVASFSCEAPGLRAEHLLRSLNGLLPDDVSVLRAAPAPAGFVAREAVSRTYEYRIWLSRARPVRDRSCVWQVRGALDVDLLGRAAALLPGRHDFSALTPSAHDYHSCVREVLVAEWAPVAASPGVPAGAEWVFTIRAGSFLHTMVRVAVGSMIDVAQGRMTVAGFAAALQSGERRRAGQTAPARGLALIAVEY
jgi:tRNA pseudouridine38-40 synthase